MGTTNSRSKFFWLTAIIGLLCILYSLIYSLNNDTYVVVLDPGHGGRFIAPKEIYGDKFNPLTGRYADVFRSGAHSWGLAEHEEVYAVAAGAKRLLQMTETSEGREKFHQILKKYKPDAPQPDADIKVHLSRGPSYHEQYDKVKDDINGPYRMFDYPHVKDGSIQPGRISRINKLKPHLVVSLHLNGGANPENGALGAVITPSHKTYRKAIDWVKASPENKRRIEQEFMSGPYRGWIDSCARRTRFQHFICDAWIYYTGYWSKSHGMAPDLNIFRGYRHNLVSWSYQDQAGWIKQARQHKPNTPYSRHLKDLKLEGAFWQRESQQEEHWRREGGPEGFGGDNLFASNEILRYIRKALLVNKVDTYASLPRLKDPYLSTWTVPTYINAVSAYLEIGYLTSRRDYQRMLRHREVYAEAVAVGIYSLLYSLNQPGDNRKKALPMGEKLDLEKYGDYFQEP